MGIFHFLKKKIKPFFDEEKEEKNETVSYHDLGNYLKTKEKLIKELEKNILKNIKEKINIFIEGIDEKIVILKSINLKEKKEHERIKHLVLLNRDLYILDVKKLISKIRSLDNLSFEGFNEKINNSLIDFKKSSDQKYKKATYLIGKEIGTINDLINNFYREYSKIMFDNKDLVQSSKNIMLIQSQIIIIEEHKKNIKDIEKSIRTLEEEIKDLKIKNKKAMREFEDIKKSDEYRINQENITQEKELAIKIEKEIISLKQSIDFKALAKTFHGSERYSSIIDKFRDNFVINYKSDNGTTLLEIIDEANIEVSNLKENMEKINHELLVLDKIKSRITDDKTRPVLRELNDLTLRIERLNEDKYKETKRFEKIENEKETALSNLKEELEKIKTNLIFT